MSGLVPRRLVGRVYPYVLVFQLLLGGLQLLDYLEVGYYPMIERRAALRVFRLGFSAVLPLVVLAILWVGVNMLFGRQGLLAAAAPLFICLYSVELGLAGGSLFMCLVGTWSLGDRGRFLDSLCWTLSFFLGLGVVHWGVLRPLGVWSPLGGAFSVMYDVHHVLRLLFPVLVLPFLLFWVVKPLIGLRWRLPELRVGEGVGSRFSALLMVFSLYLSVYMALYPHLPAVNLSGVEVGVDVENYVNMFLRLEAEGDGLLGLLGDTRAFFYLVLVFFRWSTGLDLVSSIRFLPVVLNPFFVAGCFYFCLEFFRNHEVASWCAFLSATGVYLTSAMSGYYLTNTLALGLVLFSLGLLWRALRLGCVRALVGASVLGVLLVFTHPWTMDQWLSGLAGVLLLAVFRPGSGLGSTAPYLGGYLGAVGLGELFKVVFFGGVGGVEASSAVGKGLLEFDEVIRDALYAFPYEHGGTLSNLLLVVLACAGIYLFALRGVPGRFLRLLVALSGIVYVVSFQPRKMRLLLNLPWGVLGGAVVYTFSRRKLSFRVFMVVYSLFYMLLSVGSLSW